MAPVGLYSAFATTAGVFVGFLNAYLVSRISGLKSERKRIEQRVKSINARLDPLVDHLDWRDEQISEQIDRQAQERAGDDIERFIDYHVGDVWSPDPDNLTFEDGVNNLADYLDCDRSDLTYYHIQEIRERWNDIKNELRPSGGGMFGAAMTEIPIDDSTMAVTHQIEAQWEIYDQTLLDRRNADFASVETEVRSLREEGNRLAEQYKQANPTELVEGVRSTGWAIVLSIGVPLVVYLLHAINITFTIPYGNVVEPILVFVSWSIGLILTFQYLRDEVTDIEDNLPNFPSEDEESESEESS